MTDDRIQGHPGAEDVPKDKRYEMVSMGSSGKFRMATNAWADRLRFLFSEHVKPLEPKYGWKGPCAAVVPVALAADVGEAMGFVGAIVDLQEQEGGNVRLYSEGYYIHIGS